MIHPRLQKRHWLLVAVCLTATAFSVRAAWIPVKAQVAQALLARSWQKTLAGEDNAKPWPWADTRAVGVLKVPRLGLQEYVLEGSSGRNLAFGPTLVNTTTLEQTRDRIISGHRDTHFRFLENLQIGDVLRLKSVDGQQEYRVAQMQRIDSRERELVIENDVDRLTLLTCYPFDAPTAGSPLRWLVTAFPTMN